MDKSELEGVYVRLNQLERENARLRTAGVYLFVGVVALVVIGVKLVRTRGVIEAERFVLKDRSGMVRGALGLERDGSPTFNLTDDSGRNVVTMRSLSDNTAELTLYSKGQSRVTMSATSTGAATLNFLDQQHGSVSGFYLKPDGALGLDFRRDLQSLALSIASDGASTIAFTDEDGESLGGMAVKPDGAVELGLIEHKGKVARRPVARRAAAHEESSDAAAVGPESVGPLPHIPSKIRRTYPRISTQTNS